MNKSPMLYINRLHLHPHPDNPRKNLGDLEELRESIREVGIMQNLTVVPMNDDMEDFYILIGHRRFEASDGIVTELPCVIAEGLSDREQIGIMLCENMQRSDLTFLEQAHGFQMMLDLGETVDTISEKTGFSTSTVKHRLEIAKLDKKAIDSAMKTFQPTISDYIELEKVKDIEERNRILKAAESSSEIKYEIENYIEEQTRKTNLKKYTDLLKSLGWKETKERMYFYSSDSKWKETDGLSRITLENEYDDTKINEFAQRNHEPIFYSCDGYWIIFAVKNTEKKIEKKKTKQERLEEAREKNKGILEGMRTVICDRYFEFIRDIPEKSFEELNEKMRIKFLERLFEILLTVDGSANRFKQTYNIKTKCDIKTLGDDFQNYNTMRKMMLNVWAALATNYNNKFVEWNFTKNMTVLEAHQQFYVTLYHFGFRLNDEYKSVIEGKSEYFTAKA